MQKLLDRPRLSWDTRGLVVTDDHPVVEYLGTLEEMMKARDVAWNSESAASGAE